MARTYPIPRPPDDQRLSAGLGIDVATVLQEHGYPPVSDGADLISLLTALARFLYGPTSPDECR